MITNRKLVIPGAQLTATYKGAYHVCEVVELDGGQPTPTKPAGFLVNTLGSDRCGPHRSISAAAMAVTGSSANGWRFWSMADAEADPRAAACSDTPSAETEPTAPKTRTRATTAASAKPAKPSKDQQRRNRAVAPAPPPRPPRARKPKPTTVTILKPSPNQEGVEDGFVRMFCDACMVSYIMERDPAPAGCPNGHAAVQPADPTAQEQSA